MVVGLSRASIERGLRWEIQLQLQVALIELG